MRLLISVIDKVEALEAFRGGAHIIDVKNPREGALGANFPRVIKQVREAVPSDVEVSATIGDLPNLPGTASLAALGAAVSGADYVKAGLYGVGKVREAVGLMREVCGAVRSLGYPSKVVAAGYADFNDFGGINPLELPRIAYKAGADGVLIDVKVKGARKLFDLIDQKDLTRFIVDAHGYGLTVALAGSLERDDINKLYELGADIMGVRRAVCNSRSWLTGRVQEKAVKKFVAVIEDLERA